jgi:ATP-dependent Clp protease ATP-binding subunit ClpB
MNDSVFKIQTLTVTKTTSEDNLVSEDNAAFFLGSSIAEIDLEKENENLLVIPISKEIARDFSLIGYDTTVRHIEEVLSQASKRRNFCLFGDNGVGKTAIIQGLVQRKNRSDLSMHMYKRTFYRLNTSKLLHVDDVSQINKQFDQVLLEFGQYDVLVIENFYTLVNYLKVKGANSVVIGFFEALSRRKFQSIITCSTREKALLFTELHEVHEYFHPEKVPEPNDQQLLDILRGVHKSYEDRYGVVVPDVSLQTIAALSQKYRTNLEEWAQPGRALIVLDRSIAQFSVKMNSKPAELSALQNEAHTITNELDALTYDDETDTFVNENNVDRRDSLNARLAAIQPDLAHHRKEWDDSTIPIRKLLEKRSTFDTKLRNVTISRSQLIELKNNTALLIAKGQDPSQIAKEIEIANKKISLVEIEIGKINAELAKINLSSIREHRVTSDNITETFNEITGISFKQLSQNGKERALRMEESLSSRVYGQPEATRSVSVAVRRAESGLSDDEGTPKGSFLFLGPSGTGKTALAKALAEFETGSEKNLIRIDMSEFMEKHSVSRLIGAPPGYAGYEEGGLLTNAVRFKPKSVIVFDEVEKAHADVFKILLQVLGDGRLTDGQGVTVNFDETYPIMTSNIGTPYFLDDRLSYEEAASLALKEVEKFFAPEILGRLDAIICFRRLDLPLLERVAKKRFADLNKNLGKKLLKLEVSDESTTAFCKVYKDNRYGARAIQKKLKEILEDSLSLAVLEHGGQGGGSLTAVFEGEHFKPLIFTPSPTKMQHLTV